MAWHAPLFGSEVFSDVAVMLSADGSVEIKWETVDLSGGGSLGHGLACNLAFESATLSALNDDDIPDASSQGNHATVPLIMDGLDANAARDDLGGTDPCNGGATLARDSGSFEFRHQQRPNSACIWLVACQTASDHIAATVTDLHSEARWDFVSLYDGSQQYLPGASSSQRRSGQAELHNY